MKKIQLLVLFTFLAYFPNHGRAEEPLKILVLYLQSETAIEAYVAAEDPRGASLAMEKINTRGGILGRSLEMVEVRTSSSLEAKQIAEKFVQENKIWAVVGPNTSSPALAAASVFQKAGIPMIATIATHPNVTVTGDYIFRVCFTDPFQGKVMAGYALSDLHAKTAAIFEKADSQYSQGLASFFREMFQKQGKVIGELKYLTGDVDFSEALMQVKKLNPDVVFLPGHAADSGLIMKQAYTMGLKTQFLGGDGWGKGCIGVAGAQAVESGIFSNHWHTDVMSPASKNFVQVYTRKYGEKRIAASAPLAYDAVMLLAEAARKAGTPGRKQIRDALAEIKDFQGLTGTYTFDSNGDPLNKEAVILRYENGQIVFVKSVKP